MAEQNSDRQEKRLQSPITRVYQSAKNMADDLDARDR